jgi:hypothetical protein
MFPKDSREDSYSSSETTTIPQCSRKDFTKEKSHQLIKISRECCCHCFSLIPIKWKSIPKKIAKK